MVEWVAIEVDAVSAVMAKVTKDKVECERASRQADKHRTNIDLRCKQDNKIDVRRCGKPKNFQKSIKFYHSLNPSAVSQNIDRRVR